MAKRDVREIEWMWEDGDGTSGVHTREGKLVWWHTPSGPGGHLGEVARDQEFDDFLQNGAAVTAPEDVERALREALTGEG